MTMNYFTLDGKKSGEMGLAISGEKTYGGAVRDIETVSIPGQSGDIVIDHGRYKNATIVYSCMTKDFEDLEDARDWLMAHSDKYYRLTDTYHPGEYRLARTSSFEVVNVMRTGMVVFNVTFDCDPRRFLTIGEEKDTINAGASLTIPNPTYQTAKPEILMAWPGTVNFSSTDYTASITISGSYASIIVDCEKRIAYTKNGTKINNLNAALSLGNNGIWPVFKGNSTTVVENKTSGKIYITAHWWRI